MLMDFGLCAFNCMSHFISQSLHFFTHVATQTLVQRMLFLWQGCFTSTRPWSFMMPLRDFRNVLSISNSKQWTAGNSGFPRLNECPVYSLRWDFLFFPLVSLPSSNSFSFFFPEAPGFCPQ
jgi:hypothetical protein